MKSSLFPLLLCAIVLSCGAPSANAQSPRYTVGQHLLAFEQAWEKFGHKLDARKRAVRPLYNSFRLLMTGSMGSAAQSLDKARYSLMAAKPPTAEIRWADSLTLELDRRLLDVSASVLPMRLKHFYKVNLPQPENAQLRLSWLDGNGKKIGSSWSTKITSVPMACKLPLKNIPVGDHTLLVEIVADKQILSQRDQMVSFVRDLPLRLAALYKALATVKAGERVTTRTTARQLNRWLNGLAVGVTYETNFPAHRLLAEAEAAVQALNGGKSYYNKNKTGQFWLQLKSSSGTWPVRLLVPEQAKKGKPVPLVIALHGAGGSENLFFEGYGRGKIVELCQKRGWLLVAPRSSSWLSFRFPAAALADALAEHYPVDKSKVFLVGHSMGAAQAARAANETPDRFAAVAILGGSGSIRNNEKIKTLPFFIGIGKRDWAYEGAKNMAARVKKAGVSRVTLREYDDVEHIAVVQVALPDVFAFFDNAAKR